MQIKQTTMTKFGLICSVSAILMTSGCSIWQKKGPDRYGLAPGAKRIPAMNPGGKMAQNTPPPAPTINGQAYNAPAGAPPMGYAPQQSAYVAPPPAMAPQYAPPPAAYVAPPPMAYAPPPTYNAPPAMPGRAQGNAMVDGPALHAMSDAPNSYQEQVVAPPPQPALSAYMAPPPQEPFDLTSRSLDRPPSYPSLSQVPAAPASSLDRMGNAKAAAGELEQELVQSQAQKSSAQQQALNDGLPWDAPTPPEASAMPSTQSENTMTLDEIDRRFAGERPNDSFAQKPPASSLPSLTSLPSRQPASSLPSLSGLQETPDTPDTSMTTSEPLYKYPAPDADFRMSEPSPAMASSQAELPPIKLVPPSPEPDDDMFAMNVPPKRERFISPQVEETASNEGAIPTKDAALEKGEIALDVPPMFDSKLPTLPNMPAQQEINVPTAPSVASTRSGWDASASSENPIVLTPPAEMIAGTEEGFLPESRYNKRRRVQHRRAKF